MGIRSPDFSRQMDGDGGGPPPFSIADRPNFLQALDRVLMGMGRAKLAG